MDVTSNHQFTNFSDNEKALTRGSTDRFITKNSTNNQKVVSCVRVWCCPLAIQNVYIMS